MTCTSLTWMPLHGQPAPRPAPRRRLARALLRARTARAGCGCTAAQVRRAGRRAGVLNNFPVASDSSFPSSMPGHFVLDDAFVYDFDAEEWAAVAVIDGPRRPPARVGHVIAVAPDGCLRLFGGV